MNHSKKHGLAVFLVLTVFAAVTFAVSKVSELEENLEKTRSELKKARENASSVDREMFKFKDRIVYNDSRIKAMYVEMKDLEKRLLQQREKVDNEIMKLPEYREIIKKRNDAYKVVRDLSAEETFILTQIRSARAREGVN